MRTLLAAAAAVLLGLLAPAPWPVPLPSLGLLLAVVTVLAAWDGGTGLCLGLPACGPIERRGP